MSTLIKTKALVLHDMPIGENNKRIVVLAKGIGKVVAFATGARKMNSKLLAGCQKFSYGDYYFYKGKSSYNVNQIELIETFPLLLQSFDNLSYGLYILEFTEYISKEESPNDELMKLVLKTLKVLESATEDFELIKAIFELKAMSYIGLAPQMNACVKCNSVDNLAYFSIQEGGMVCSDCMGGDKYLMKISGGTAYTMQFILSSSDNKLFHFKLDKEVLDEFSLIMNRFVQYNINKSFKSLELL
jgi:DNA repair protein RecO (recombination protein O)